MLGGRKRKRRRVNERKKKALKDLDDRREKRDGAVRRTLVKGLSRLRDGDNIGLFPNGREVSVIDGKIEELSQVRNSAGTKMLQMKGSNAVRTRSSRVARKFYSIRGQSIRKRTEFVVELMLISKFPHHSASFRVLFMRTHRSELLIETIYHGPRFVQDFITKGNRLIWRLTGALPR
jgi:hypothetical protein